MNYITNINQMLLIDCHTIGLPVFGFGHCSIYMKLRHMGIIMWFLGVVSCFSISFSFASGCLLVSFYFLSFWSGHCFVFSLFFPGYYQFALSRTDSQSCTASAADHTQGNLRLCLPYFPFFFFFFIF